ncbi:hypothetical protein LJC74_06645 [Eubacteriales bacterium OttesenSCG-928-A19]|nr:hypothetical protein [Eubacteriales bacterium OttesenSCG-928-A19]
MAKDTQATRDTQQAAKTKAKVKAKPKTTASRKKPAKEVLDNVGGIVDIVILDDDIFDILYDEALLEEAAILAALEDEGYDVELIECGC